MKQPESNDVDTKNKQEMIAKAIEKMKVCISEMVETKRTGTITGYFINGVIGDVNLMKKF